MGLNWGLCTDVFLWIISVVAIESMIGLSLCIFIIADFDKNVSLSVWTASSQKSRPVECELETSNNGLVPGPSESPQRGVSINSVDTRDERVYSVIDDTAATISQPDTVPPPPEAPLYQAGLCGYYEGLVPSPNEEPQRPSAQPLSIYDKLSMRGLSGNTAETLLKMPYFKRAKSMPPIGRFPNTLWTVECSLLDSKVGPKQGRSLHEHGRRYE